MGQFEGSGHRRITRETSNPQGGEIIKDERGEPTGVLVDTAADLVAGKIPPPDSEKILKRCGWPRKR